MIGETGFTLLLVGIWLSAFAFGSLVIYWFIRQGFSERGVTESTQFPLESREETRKSLLIWAAFFAVLTLVILLGG